MIRIMQIVISCSLGLYLIGCSVEKKEEKPIWEQVKIGDIAPTHSNEQLRLGSLHSINFDIYVFEVPSEKVEELDKIWGLLYTRPLRFTNYGAFNANLFCVRFGQIQIWDRIRDTLITLKGQKIVTVSVFLVPGQANDLAVTGLSNSQDVTFISTDGSRHKVTIGPGIVILRLKADKIPGVRGVCKLIASPVFTIPIRSPIPPIAARAKAREFQFDSVAFGLEMGPGDFVILGPKKYVCEQSSLSGLFFNNPEGRLFFEETQVKGPERISTVRVFLIVCTNITD